MNARTIAGTIGIILLCVYILIGCSKRDYRPPMCVNCVIIGDSFLKVTDEKGDLKEITVFPSDAPVTIKEIKFAKEGRIQIEVKADVDRSLKGDADVGLNPKLW